MKTLTIRGISDDLYKKIKEDSNVHNKSINKTIIEILNKKYKNDNEIFKIYDDLDQLAGSWTDDDYNEFNDNTNDFNSIDKDLWV